MVPSLYVVAGRDQGTRLLLDSATFTIGRTSENSLQLRDTEVSRRHAELRQHEDGYAVVDLGSSNGTFVNDKRIEESQLVSGDRVRMGRTVLLYTAAPTGEIGDLSASVSIVETDERDDESRIVHALSHEASSELFAPDDVDSSHFRHTPVRTNLEIMYRTALAVSRTLDVDELLARILQMVFEWIDADRGCIMLRQTPGEPLVPKVRQERQGRSTSPLHISRAILDYVIENREGVLTTNAGKDERWDPTQSIVGAGTREAICVPMQGRYDTVGVIYVDTTTPPLSVVQSRGTPKFQQDHLRLMVAIGHQAALAIEDTQFHQAMLQSERLAAVGQAIASLSHHIKNILQGVRGGSYLIELGLEDHGKAIPPTREDLDPALAEKSVQTIRKGWDIVEKNQQRISSLVMDMLTFSKEREPEPVPADLNHVAADVVSMCEHLADEQGTQLSFAAAEGLPLLMFDPEGLHRAILNVVSNAIDACADRDEKRVEVFIEFDAEKNWARVVVRDTGAGIDQDELDSIFTAFVSHKGGRGTGLGLPVSRKILEEHGGTINVLSELDKGSTFCLEFPAEIARVENSPNLGETTLPTDESAQ